MRTIELMRRAGNGGFARPLMMLIAAFSIAACGGGGGGGDNVEPPPPPPGGSGTGADGVPTFWRISDWNVASGAAYSLRQTDDGGFVAAGFEATGFSGAPPDLYVLKSDNHGVAQWSKRIPSTGGGIAYDVRQTADGYVVAGTGNTTGVSTVMLVKLDSAGNVAAGWPKTSYGPAGAKGAFALQAINDGKDGYLVVGAAEAGPLYVLRVDGAGTQLWEKFNYAEFCGGGGRGEGRSITSTYDGNFVIAGRTGCSQFAGFLLKINGTNGNEMWRSMFDDANVALYTELTAVVETGDHSLVAVGATGSDCGPNVTGTCDALVIKADSAGNELWRRLYGGAAKDGASGVALAADGSYLVAGYSYSYGGAIQDPSMSFLWSDAMLLKITPNGATTWQKIKGLRPRGADVANTIATTTDGGFAIGGSSGGDPMIAKFDKNGDTVNLGASYDLTINVPTTQGTITFNNAVEVAGVGALGLIVPHQVGGALLDRLIAASGNSLPSDFCTGGGTYTFTPGTITFAVNASYAITFANCVIGPAGGEQNRINGGATLSIDAVTGTPASGGTYTLQMTVSSLSLVIDEPATSLAQNYSGGLRIARNASPTSVADTLSSPTSVTLGVTESSSGVTTRSVAYGAMNVHTTVPASGAFSVGQPGDILTANSGGNTFTVTVLQPIVLAAPSAQPNGGSYKVTAGDNSRLTAIITSGATESTAALAVDTNGDGTDDGTLSVSWDFIY
jgi:hypothetical protein